MTPGKIREELEFCERQKRIALKNKDATSFVYWERKVQAGHFLLAMWPAVACSLIMMAVLIIGGLLL